MASTIRPWISSCTANRLLSRVLGGIAGMLLLSVSIPATAEVYGLMNGRSANLSTLDDLSVEGGFITGDQRFGNYDHFGARVNYRLVPGLMIYGDLGISEYGFRFGGSSDGAAFGLGVFYQLRDLFSFADSSAKVSYHKVGGDIDQNAIVVELLISGLDPITDSGLNWYANTGIHRFSGNGSDTELGIGGGVFMPLGPGEIYAGADFIDEIIFGLGFRYSIR